MKKLLFVLLLFSGCSWLAPNTDQANSLREQTELLKEQNVQLKRIASALELLSKK